MIDTVVDGASLDYTITEFPFFSFLLGDLHAHMLALPFLIIVVALGLNYFCSEKKAGPRWVLANPWESASIALALGSLAFINTWDYPVFALVFAILVLLKSNFDWSGDALRVWGTALAIALPIIAASALLFLPFFLSLDTQASGISPLGDYSTRPFFFFLIWGPLFAIASGFLVKHLWHTFTAWRPDTQHLSIIASLTLLPFLLWAAIQVLGLWLGLHLLGSGMGNAFVDHAGDIGTRFLKLLPAMIAIILASYTLLRRAGGVVDRVPQLSVVLLCMALFLLAGVELFFVIDLFGNRMNTVFKVYYQSWLLLSIVSAYALYYVISHRPASADHGRVSPLGRLGFLRRHAVHVWIGVVVVLIAASSYYSVGAAWGRTAGPGGGTLDGLEFLRSGGASAEYDAILWLRDDAPKGRLVEAVGGTTAPMAASHQAPAFLRSWDGRAMKFSGGETGKKLRNEKTRCARYTAAATRSASPCF